MKMVMNAPDRQSPDDFVGPGKDDSPLAAFDFDGTLTVRDSFNAFLRWRAGALGYLAGMARLGPAALAWMGDRDLTRFKAAMVRVFLTGVRRAELEAQAEAFAERAAPRLFRPDALETWRRLRDEGARLVIVTASPETVVAPFARRLGADGLIGTRLAFDAEDRVAGLAGLNCRGPEKVVRLKAAFGDRVRLIAAYGDTAGDRELLALADRGYLRVFKGRP